VNGLMRSTLKIMKATMHTAPLMPSAVARDLPVTAAQQESNSQQQQLCGAVHAATLEVPLLPANAVDHGDTLWLDT
jgi:hypothetical protein